MKNYRLSTRALRAEAADALRDERRQAVQESHDAGGPGRVGPLPDFLLNMFDSCDCPMCLSVTRRSLFGPGVEREDFS